jgi:outer membrane biosynthesis protein TonB
VGRHSSPEQSPFLRSLAGWFLPWLLVAVVAIAAVWIAVGALAGGPLRTNPPAAASGPAPASPSPSGSEAGTTPEPSPTHKPKPKPTPKPTHKPKPKPTHKPKPSPSPAALITQGVTVQVLNATSSPGAEDVMAARLADLGFRIVATGSASRTYADTTVFWSSASARKAARALAHRFDWKAAPKPANLSPSVAVHVVVGLDES